MRPLLQAVLPLPAFVVWYRENRRGARWRKVGTVPTFAEAVRLIVGPADWRIAEVEPKPQRIRG